MTVHTWANGYGIWHARVPEGPSAAHIARHAIRAELKARGDVGAGYVIRLVKADPAICDAIPGTVVYREV